MANTKRDLTNNLIRSKAKLNKAKASQVRKEHSEMPNPIQKLQNEIKIKQMALQISIAPFMAAWQLS